jgi:hypothetical protein
MATWSKSVLKWAASLNKNWWKTFFKPLTAEVMFKPAKEESQDLKSKKFSLKSILRKNEYPRSLLWRRTTFVDFCKKHSVTGLDYSKDFLKVANAKLKKQNRYKRI